MINPSILSASLNNSLISIKGAQRIIDLASLRLATGKKVNSALDNPQNFFAAKSLGNRAADLNRLLDGIGSGIKVIEEAAHGTKAVEDLLELAKSHTQNSLDALRAQSAPVVAVPPLSSQILASNPVAYWQLDETTGTTATNQGSIGAAVNGTYLNTPTLGAPALYSDAVSSVGFNGINEGISVPTHAQINGSNQPLRTVELVFNANTTSGRQVLYEEGGGTNALSIYIFNGSVYVNGRDAGAWGPVTISAPIVAGQTYHVAFTFDFPNSTFTGYLDGVSMGSAPVNSVFAAHTAGIGIGYMNGGTWFHDGVQGGNNFYLNGRISDVAVYNTALSAATISDHALSVTGGVKVSATDQKFENILDQIDMLVKDAQYRGINLLMSDDLTTYFNETKTSRLETKGVDFTSRGLGIKRTSFATEDGLNGIIESINKAILQVRSYGTTLSNNLNIIKIRNDFTQDTTNILLAGAAELVDADQNEEGATLLAAQTRLNLGLTSLSIASQSRASVLNLFA